MVQSYFATDTSSQNQALKLAGDWIIDNANDIRDEFDRADFGSIETLDATGVARMDSWGAIYLQSIAQRSQAKLNLSADQKKLVEFLPKDVKPSEETPETDFFTRQFEAIGEVTARGATTAYGMMTLVGEISVCFIRNIANPRSFRFHSIVRHIEETGLRALPIIILLAVLISMVISYQAATQLLKFGATIFTVDLTVISILREMGVLTTAIMVAGRSGSAFAAEIGVMKLREEIDALKTMGFDPVELLILPRLIAMIITLPLLAFIADLAGLAGGGLIAVTLLDIPIDQYIDRVDMVAKPTMFFVGLIKAPMFAFAITIIGTYQGMKVSGSAESVGKLTTVAVVQSIFAVIMIDALFSIVFSNMGI